MCSRKLLLHGVRVQVEGECVVGKTRLGGGWGVLYVDGGEGVGFGRWRCSVGEEGLAASVREGRGWLRIEVEHARLLPSRTGERTPRLLWLGGETFYF